MRELEEAVKQAVAYGGGEKLEAEIRRIVREEIAALGLIREWNGEEYVVRIGREGER